MKTPETDAVARTIYGEFGRSLECVPAELSRRLERERDEACAALERIRNFPVHSEPVGGALAMQDIADEALKGGTQ